MKSPQYNTQRPSIRIREYGRNVHKLVEQCKQIEDRKKRTKRAYEIVAFMGQLNPEVKDSPEQRQKLWDHLFIMASFDLDVDAPYPIPDPENIKKKPSPMPYPQTRLKFRYYGKNIERMILAAQKMDEGDKKQEFVNQVASYMKMAYIKYNDEKVSDDMISGHMEKLSGGALKPTQIYNLVKTGDSKSSSKSSSRNRQKKKSRSSSSSRRK